MASLLSLERWREVEKLFLAATEIEPARRQFWLRAACGNDEGLLKEVTSLFNYDEGVQPEIVATLEAIESGAASVIEGEPAAGARLGPYRVGREIGRGGTSVVYLGERADGEYRMAVAIKLIKRGMDTEAVVARLRRERGILATLEHPGIARLLDGGTSADGRPWIAMEHVAGQPINRYCDDRGLGVAERCALLAQVADAVAYAHRMLVVHRDLKPGNILVGADGRPKLLDFGIAKLLDDEGEAPLTGAARPYTPGYASPEQIAGKPITTASDIFSLGIVGFELLAGVRPQDGTESLRHAVLRQGAGARPARALDHDLDLILQQARRLEPERRYPSAAEFAEDLRLHLGGRPIRARRESLTYRAGKFVARHRLSTAATLLLAGGFAVSAGLYLRQQHLAARRFDELHHFANAFLFDVNDQLDGVAGTTQAREVIVRRAVDYLNALAAEKRGDPALQHEAANAWRKVGDLQGDPLTSSLHDSDGARASYQRSIALLEPLAARARGPRRTQDVVYDLVSSYAQMASLERNSNNYRAADALVQKALPMASRTGTPPQPDLQAQYGQLLVIYTWVLDGEGRIPECVSQAEAAIQQLQPAAAVNPEFEVDVADALSRKAGCEQLLNQQRAALADYEHNMQVRRAVAAMRHDRYTQRNLLLAYGHLGDMTSDRGNPSIFNLESAIGYFHQAQQVAQSMVAADATDITAQLDYAISTSRLGDALSNAEQHRAALPQYQAAARPLATLARQRPSDGTTAFYLAYVLSQIGQQYAALDQPAAALAPLDQAAERFHAMEVRDPTHVTAFITSLPGIEAQANAEATLGQTAAALRTLAELDGDAARVQQLAGHIFRYQVYAPIAWAAMGDAYAKLRQPAEARTYYQRAADAWRKLEPLRPPWSDNYAAVLAHLRSGN